MYSAVIIGSLLVFIISERTFLHFSRTARRAFWYLLSCAVGVWLVRWLQTVEGLGMVWVFLSAVLAASVVEDEVAKMTGLVPLNIEATQRVRVANRTPEAQGKAERIMDIVASITRGKGYTAGTKQLVSRVSGATMRLQRSLHALLDAASPQELNYVVCTVNVPAMLEVMTSATMELLVKRKLPVLETASRAAVVDGLQKLGLRYRPLRQVWARDVIVETRGLELTHFKAYIDDGGDYHTMYKLVYNDMQGKLQAEVLEHLLKEGAALTARLQSAGSMAPPGVVLKVLSDIDDTVFSSGGSFPAGLDTRYPRKCYYPGALAFFAALDRCFAQKHANLLQAMGTLDFNPSLAVSEGEQFQESSMLSSETSAFLSTAMPPRPHWSELATPRDRAADLEPYSPRAAVVAFDRVGPPLSHHQEGSNLVLLSARPESYKGLTESESYRKYFQPLVQRGDLDTSPTMLLGSLDSGPRALFKLMAGRWFLPPEDANPKTAAAALYQTIAAKKLSRFRQYATIYPEAAFIFVGDNGQGDVLCAEILYSSAMHAAAPHPSQLLASFIHRVVPPASTLSMLRSSDANKGELLTAWKDRGIYLHRTHLGMAAQALQLGLLDEEALHYVLSAAKIDFRRIVARYDGRQVGRNLEKAAQQLNKELEAANDLLPLHLRVSPLAAPDDAPILKPEDSDRAMSAALSDATYPVAM